MSIENIKKLFSERVSESVALNIANDSRNEENVNGNSSNGEEEEPYVSIDEIDAGITEYLNDCKGFNAVIKERFSDFQVHEIDLDGNIVTLTNTDIPVVPEEQINEDILTSDICEKLQSLQDKVVNSVEIDVTDFSKEKRKDIHRFIKSKYGSNFVSNTVEDGDTKKLIITSEKEHQRTEPWFSTLGKYLHFVLFKANLDTGDAINIIASKLRTKPSNLTYAGTKDKRAKTSQLVSMWHLNANRLNGLNKCLKYMKVGNYVYKNTPLKLGDLKGNLFEIALRNVTESDEVINEALQTVKDNGFINYYGLQRFGQCAEIPTYEIGKALVLGDFKTAVELILKPRRGKMKNDLKEARNSWWKTRDAAQALKCLRSKDRTIEGKLLLGLSKHGKNAYVNALDWIPRNTRLLYLHAYQSFIWNKVLSKRIKQFGKSVIEGDLILLKEEEVAEPDEESSTTKQSVRHLTQDEISNYEIYDVVHPLPGHNVTYPNNVIKEWYEEFLKEDDLSSEKLKQKVKQYSLSGAQRHIVKKVKDLSWNICYYSDPEEDLILSDLDKLEGETLKTNEDSKHKAVILKFSLDSSTYATMALREILKIDTSVSYQTTLSNSNKRCNQDDVENPRKKSKI